jgi:hypothetical protein
MSYSLEDALGLQKKKPVHQEAVKEEEYSETELKQVLRRIFVFERRVRGDTVEEICTFLHEKGYPASRRTVFYDLRSDEVSSLIDELIRVQFRDITLLRGYALQDSEAPDLKALAAAIAARGFMISCLKPKLEPKVEVNVNATAQSTVVNTTAHLLEEYDAIIAEEMAKEAGALRKDNPAE